MTIDNIPADDTYPEDFATDPDTLFKQSLIDQDDLQAIKVSDQPPAGTYVTNPSEFTPSIQVRTLVPKEGWSDTEPREIVTFRGRGEATVGVETYTARLEFEMSADKRFAAEYLDDQRTGNLMDGEDGRKVKYDIRSRLWKDACLAFQQTYHESAKTKEQVVEYLTSMPIRVRTYIDTKGDMKASRIFPGGRR